MAQGEFALVTDILEKAIHKPSNLISDHDVYAVLADAAVQQRDQDALREYAPLLEGATASLEHKLYLATAHRAWGVLHRLGGQFEEAEARLEQAITLFSGLDTRWQLGRTHFELGELAADRSQPAEAKQHYVRALVLFEEMGAIPDAARTQAGLSKVN
jgi:tetratricopeptide (TPR) repeat protein